MPQLITISLILCGLGLLISAALHDAVVRTIPNWMPAGLAVVGLILRLREGEMIVSLGIAAVLFVFLYLLWLRGLIGGGDVKLIPAASLAIAPSHVPEYVLFVPAAGGILALLYLALSHLIRRPLPGRRHNFVARIGKAEAWRMHRRGPLPYAVAIAAAAFPFVFKSFSG